MPNPWVVAHGGSERLRARRRPEEDMVDIAGAVPASMGKRLLAYLIDGALYGVLTLAAYLPVVAAVLGDGLSGGAVGGAALSGGALVLTAVGALALLAFAVLQWVWLGTKGWTVGRKIVGTRVVDVDGGGPIGLGRALVRLLVVAAGALVLAVGALVVLLSPLFDPSGWRRGWHDKAARDVVLDVKVGRNPVDAPDGSVARYRLESLAGRASGGAGGYGAPAGSGGTGTAATPGAVPPPPPPPEAVGTGRAVPPQPPPAPPTPTPTGSAPPPPPGPAGGIIGAVPGVTHGYTPPPPPVDPYAGATPGERSVDPAPGTGPLPEPAAQARREAAEVAPVASGGPADGGSGPRSDESWPADPGMGEALSTSPAPDDALWGPGAAAPAHGTSTATGPDDVDHTILRPTPRQAPVPAAEILLSDGRRITVTGTTLLGRKPAPDPGEEVGDVVVVDDTTRSVSKTHLLIGVDAEGLWVEDRGSTNGTVVTLPDGEQVIGASAQQVRVPRGASVAFGEHAFEVLGE